MLNHFPDLILSTGTPLVSLHDLWVKRKQSFLCFRKPVVQPMSDILRIRCRLLKTSAPQTPSPASGQFFLGPWCLKSHRITFVMNQLEDPCVMTSSFCHIFFRKYQFWAVYREIFFYSNNTWICKSFKIFWSLVMNVKYCYFTFPVYPLFKEGS